MSKPPADDALLQWINEAVFTVDPQCRIISFNRAAEELTGYTRDEAMGRPCSEIFRSDICASRCAVKESIAKGRRVPRRRVLMKHRDGTSIPIAVSSSPIFDEDKTLLGAVESIRSLSEVERLTELIAHESDQRKSILDSLAEGVITVDHDWHVTSCNAAAGRILGLESQRAMGLHCSDVLRADRCEDGCPLARTLRDGDRVRDDPVHVTRFDGRSLEVSLNAAVLYGTDGEAMGGVLSFRELNEVERLRAELAGEHHFHGIVGKSTSMQAVFGLIEEVAESASTVLITGESGTGKEMVANALQFLSPRRPAPFVKVNCSVLSEGLLESELFGHTEGAFTDARQSRRGRFELADGGTLFLDEIGELSSLIQVKLLRVLQEHSFERVGGETSIKVDVRIIAATNRDLEARVAAGGFREDLFYRLNVIPVHVPPLRERRDDIPLLVDHFLRKYQVVTGKNIERIQNRAMDALVSHPWPGNVRQLENAVEYAFARARGGVITLDLLPPDIRGGGSPALETPADPERARILCALERHHWHHGRAAAELGLSRTTLWRRMKQLGLDPA
jgi:PAS domain S-box-containing protein